MFEDLRRFLAHLEDLGQLKRVADEVSTKYEIAAGRCAGKDLARR
jgi:3-polyprenyl-4-hydroxybenzoate decarboxylase